MSNKLQQLATLTTIRKLVEKDFPYQDFSYIEARLRKQIKLETFEEIEYDESRCYIIVSVSYCKVCNATSKLTEIPTLKGSFHICSDCRKKIASAEPEEEEEEDE